MSCCAEGTNGCLDYRRRAFPLGGQVSAEWSRVARFIFSKKAKHSKKIAKKAKHSSKNGQKKPFKSRRANGQFKSVRGNQPEIRPYFQNLAAKRSIRQPMEWSRCPGSMARRARDSVAPLRRSSAGWMPARIGRLSAGVGRRHPVTIRKASLMAGSMRRVWALRHQTATQYSAVEWTRARLAVRNVVAPAPHQAASIRVRRVMSASCEVTRGVGDTWATCPMLLRGIWAQSRRAGFRCCIWLKLTFSFLVVKMEGCRHSFCCCEL